MLAGFPTTEDHAVPSIELVTYNHIGVDYGYKLSSKQDLTRVVL